MKSKDFRELLMERCNRGWVVMEFSILVDFFVEGFEAGIGRREFLYGGHGDIALPLDYYIIDNLRV